MKNLILILVLMVVTMGVEARTLRDVFADEPGKVFTLLPKTTRLDMLDYYDNEQLVSAKNNMGDESQLIKVDENFLHIRMSATRTVQMLMVPTKKDTLVAVIETFETPAKDSHISFYDAQWCPLVNKHFKMPSLDDFVVKGTDKKKSQELLQAVPFALISLTLEGDDHKTLVARHHLKDFFVESEYKPLEAILMPELTYQLNGIQWKLKK